jgi:hypothetical protein
MFRPAAGLRSGPNITNALELLIRQFPDLVWVVPGILPEGLALLVGSPKLGKSWMVLDIALAVDH